MRVVLRTESTPPRGSTGRTQARAHALPAAFLPCQGHTRVRPARPALPRLPPSPGQADSGTVLNTWLHSCGALAVPLSTCPTLSSIFTLRPTEPSFCSHCTLAHLSSTLLFPLAHLPTLLPPKRAHSECCLRAGAQAQTQPHVTAPVLRTH